MFELVEMFLFGRAWACLERGDWLLEGWVENQNDSCSLSSRVLAQVRPSTSSLLSSLPLSWSHDSAWTWLDVATGFWGRVATYGKPRAPPVGKAESWNRQQDRHGPTLKALLKSFISEHYQCDKAKQSSQQRWIYSDSTIVSVGQNATNSSCKMLWMNRSISAAAIMYRMLVFNIGTNLHPWWHIFVLAYLRYAKTPLLS